MSYSKGSNSENEPIETVVPQNTVKTVCEYNNGSLFYKTPNPWLYKKTNNYFPFVPSGEKTRSGWHYMFKLIKDGYGIGDDEKNQFCPCTSKPMKLINKLDYIKQDAVLKNGHENHRLDKNCYLIKDDIYVFALGADEYLPSESIFLGTVDKNDIIRAKEKYTWKDRDPRIHSKFINSLWNL